MDKKIVKEIALANGFKLKEQPNGTLELNPYVYVFADKLVEHQQAKVEGMQEEFAEDERFLKEQIEDKDLKISNFEYLQGMDKELIQTLQGRSAALQDRVNELQKRIDTALEKIDRFYKDGCLFHEWVYVAEQALKGGEEMSKHKSLSPEQKLTALSMRFFSNYQWQPKEGDYYTTPRNDLELYRIVKIEAGKVFTEYCDKECELAQWDEVGFLTEGFGVHRTHVPLIILEQVK